MSELYDMATFDPESTFFDSIEDGASHSYEEWGPVEINYSEHDYHYPVELTVDLYPGRTVGFTLSRKDLEQIANYWLATN